MKKQILTLSAVLALTAMNGCGRPKTDQIGVESEIHRSNQINQFQANVEMDTRLADGTIITFPEGKDLDGYEYAYSREEFDGVMSRLPHGYGNTLPRAYTKDQTSAEKISQIAAVILSLGKLKDMSYVKLKQAQFGVKATEAKVKPMISGLLQNFPCFPLNENKKKCKLVADETTQETPKFSKKCSQLKRNKKKYVDLTEDQAKALEQGVIQCGALQNKISEIKGKKKLVETIRETGRNIGVGLTLDYSEYANFSGLVVVNSKAKDDGAVKSKISFNETKTKVEDLILGLSFGTSGFKEYSLENGGISNLKYGQTKNGTRFLKFHVNGEYRIEAELTLSSRTLILHESGATYTEVRLKGSTENFFPDGKVRKGVMSLQIDTLD